jgi:trk system potassium uptake protein TrkA
VVVATSGDNTNLVIAQIAQNRFQAPCVVTRVLDPARAAFYETLGLRTVCPTSGAIDQAYDAICATPGRAR